MRTCIICILFALVLSLPCTAVDTGALEQAVPDSAREIMGDSGVEEFAAGSGFLNRLWHWALASGKCQLGQAAGSAGVVLTVTLLCSVAAAAGPDGRIPPYVLLGGALAIMGVCAGSIRSYLGLVGEAMEELSEFSRALLPCVAAANAAVGRGAAGAARYTLSALFMDVLMSLGSRFVLPMLYGYCAVCTANAALPGGAMGGPVKLMRWACGTALKAITTVFTLCLSLTGVITGSADKLAGSAAKAVISAALPVVGKIVSDAADVYLAGAKILRGAVGLFGLAAVLCVCVGPFVGLGLHYLLFKAAAMISEPFSDGRLSGLVGDVAACYGMALGLLGSVAAMLFVSAAIGAEVLSG